MSVSVQCPNSECGASLSFSVEMIGRRVRCRGCGFKLIISASDDGFFALPRGEAKASSTVTRSAPLDRLGRYEIRNEVGSGAFGVVYRGHDPVAGRDVALKVQREDLVPSPSSLERFSREARAASLLSHPNIVPWLDSGVLDGRRYIASVFVEGRTLARAIGGKGLGPRLAARIARELADALHHAHQIGIVHRDVKPSNVMLDRDGRALLMDFGLARLAESEARLTQDGFILGTPAYLAPEQAIGRSAEADASSDQYSLGAVFYEMLAGQPPFVGPLEIVLFATIHQPPPPPSSLNRDIPADLETICLKALAKRPDGRYASCRELADDLGRWLEGEPVLAGRQVAPPTPMIEPHPPLTIEVPAEPIFVEAAPRRRGAGARIAATLSALAIVVVGVILAKSAGTGLLARRDMPGPRAIERKSARTDFPASTPQPASKTARAGSGMSTAGASQPGPPSLDPTIEDLSTATSIPDGYISLFNGRDFEGWVEPGDDSPFKVEAGEIVARSTLLTTSKEYHLKTSKHYSNFSLKARFKLEFGRAGLNFLSRLGPNEAVVGPWFDLREGFQPSFGSRESRPPATSPRTESPFQPPEWHELEIRALAGRIVVGLDGREVENLADERLNPSGFIALKLFGEIVTEARFKDISLKELEPTPATASAKPRDRIEATQAKIKSRPRRAGPGPVSGPVPLVQVEEGFVPLYVGGDPLKQGWRMIGAGSLRVEEGDVLATRGEGYLAYTNRTFGNFSLLVDVQFTKPRDAAGIFFHLQDLPPDIHIPVPVGYEIELNGNTDAGNVTGSFYSERFSYSPAQKPIPQAPIGEWNTVGIKVIGRSLEVWVNGKLVKSHQLPDATPGIIALQHWDDSSSGRFRNIRIMAD